ncbi:DUF1559 domain-containing protein [Rubinisphaera sp. JC750]|uniref:DUF1559 family PulG-like putative transporter n=1 Tax=Rubinisphaera sp. JC750 TaxID=2898658 RepID=UPI001F48605F|nr:DUF1559 domain-containing protein [Rubinisphaera sp. JC750]
MNDPSAVTPQVESTSDDAKPKRRWPVFLGGLVVGAIVGGLVVRNIVVPWEFREARAAARTVTSMSKMRDVGIAAQNFAVQNRSRLPAAVSRNDEGEPLHSWRINLLEYMDGASFAGVLDLSEPWDSEKNQAMLGVPNYYSEMFQVPGSPAAGTVHSSFFAITGENTPFPTEGQGTLDEISANDGLASTLMFVEAADMGIAWAEPRDILFDALTASPKDLRGKGPSSHRPNGAPIVIFCDGHASILNGDMDPAVLRALATWNGGEAVSPDEF